MVNLKEMEDMEEIEEMQDMQEMEETKEMEETQETKADWTNLDELIGHLWRDIHAFGIVIPRLLPPPLTLQRRRPIEVLRARSGEGLSVHILGSGSGSALPSGSARRCAVGGSASPLTHFARDSSVPFLAGRGPPSKTMKGVMPWYRSSRTLCIA